MKSNFFKIFLIISFLSFPLFSQSLEPRLYSNIPKDLNFLVLGYVKSLGGLELNTQLDLDNVKMDVDGAVLAYARGLDFFGKSAKIDVVIPYIFIKGDAIYNGSHIDKDIGGLGDIKSRFSVNLYGAPSLSLKDFMSYKQDFIIGTSIQLTFPTGQYDSSKLINIGRNMWAAKFGLGASKRFDQLIVELAVDGEFYSKNSSYFNGNSYEQDPVYSFQSHLIYTLKGGVWIGADANYYIGGMSKINGISKDNSLENSRFGAVVAFPISRYDSIKITASRGISTRVGTDFSTLGLFYQHRWGAGL